MGDRDPASCSLYALIPVLWIISLSLKTPATIADGSFFPSDDLVRELRDALRRRRRSPTRCVNSIGIALIATLISIVLASMAAYAIARLDFPGKALILVGRAGGRDVPADLDRRLAVRPVARDRPVRHLARADHPVHDVHAAARDLHAVGVLPRDPVGARAGGAGRRRDAVAGVPQGDRAAGRAGRRSRPRSSSSSSRGTTSCSRTR